VPSASLKKAGFVMHSLGRDLPQAFARAEALNARVDDFYAGKSLVQSPLGPKPGTLAALDLEFQASTQFTDDIGERSRKDYLYNIKRALDWAGDIPVNRITKGIVTDWVEALYRPVEKGGVGHANARNATVHLRRLLSYAVYKERLPVNPAGNLKLTMPKKRKRQWSEAEYDALVDAAIKVGLPSMALAIRINWYFGQRPEDIRKLAWTGYDGHTIELRQSKSETKEEEGRLVRVPVPFDLKLALDAAPRTSTQIVVSESTGRPYRESHFQHTFADIRAAARMKVGDEEVPVPKDVQFRDLRRTVITAMGRGGATVMEMQAVSGHETLEILTTYTVPDQRFAQGGMDALEKGRKRAKGERS
jgi:integrase